MEKTHRFYRLNSRLVPMVIIFLTWGSTVTGQDQISNFDQQIRQLAYECRDEVTVELNKLISSNKLSLAQLFDTFYIPIPNTNPQKFNTQYDKFTDENIRIILDKYLEKDKRIKFVVAVDRNGYLPTHNSRYSKPLTGDGDYDVKNNRTKRMFNDRTGLAAARNQEPYLFQRYKRDTGETMTDLSIPVFIQNKHWGAIRIGYQQ